MCHGRETDKLTGLPAIDVNKNANLKSWHFLVMYFIYVRYLQLVASDVPELSAPRCIF